MSISWRELTPLQKAMLLRTAQSGSAADQSKWEMRTIAALRLKDLLRPGHPRQQSGTVRGRWYLTAKARRLVAEQLGPEIVQNHGRQMAKAE